MTKSEFIQEAALRLITARPDATMGQIADWATDLAGEFFHDGVQTTGEPEILTAFPNSEPIQAVAKEIARLEQEKVDKLNAEYIAKGLYGRWQKSGAGVRFINACHCTRYGHKQIDKVEELIAEGRHKFTRRHGAGNKLMELLDKALESLYNIKAW